MRATASVTTVNTAAVHPLPPPLISHFYEWNRKLFLTPDHGYDPYEDPLSREGSSIL